MDEKVSGFGYCSESGPVHVIVYRNQEGKYYLSINYWRSDVFGDLKDTAALWGALAALEKIRL